MHTCIHCGDDCGKYPVIYEGKAFCCHGCKAVYTLINENKLQKYYELESNPGVKAKSDHQHSRFAYLDNEEIIGKMIDFSDGEISKVCFYVPSIHCSSCIWLLENLNKLNENIISSMVNFSKKEVNISFRQQEISLRQLVELLASIAYEPQITLEQLDKTKKPGIDKSLLIKIGIAGFAFGNIMLFSMANYIPGKELVDDHFRDFFSWLNLLLSVPVVFYCASDYFQSSFKNLRVKNININLPIAIGIVALFLQSILETVLSTGPGYYDSLTGLVFFLLIGRWYQDKTYRALSFDRDYKSYFPVAVTKLNGKQEQIIPIKNLLTGDIILVRNQELIPADSILLSEEAFIDYSFVTGESRPQRILKGTNIFAGGKQVGKAIELEIRKEIEQSKLTTLWNQENFKSSDQSKMKSLIDKVGKNFTFGVLTVALAAVVFWMIKDPSKALIAAISILIVACPCAIALSMPFAFGNTLRLFGKMGFYLKKAGVVENIAKAVIIVFDKTGTITLTKSNEVNWHGKELSTKEMELIKALSRQSSHPLSQAIYYSLPPIDLPEVSEFSELNAKGIEGIVLNDKIKIGSEIFVTGNTNQLKAPASLVYISINNEQKGYFSISNKYREGFYELINQLKNDYELHLISGDNDYEKEYLSTVFPNKNHIRFNLSPEDKLNYIKTLQKNGKKVIMIGDGLNDAGALRESYAGISIADDVFQFSPACDAILNAANFNQLPFFIYSSVKVMRIVKTSYFISLFYNITGVVIAFMALLTPIIAAILMPLSSVSVVAFVTLTTSILIKKQKYYPNKKSLN